MQLKNHTDLIGCEECDAVFQRVPLATGEYAYCSCCGAELYRKINNFNTLLAMIVTALIVFIIANSFSIIKVELQGIYSETTLLGAAWIMFQTDRAFVGVLLMLTTFIVPLLYILLMTYVLTVIMGIRREVFRNSRKTVRVVLRTLYFLRTWGMVEVFLIGILVTLVKLVGMVVVIPGIALWAIAILSVLLVYIGSIKIKDLWDAIDVYVPL